MWRKESLQKAAVMAPHVSLSQQPSVNTDIQQPQALELSSAVTDPESLQIQPRGQAPISFPTRYPSRRSSSARPRSLSLSSLSSIFDRFTSSEAFDFFVRSTEGLDFSTANSACLFNVSSLMAESNRMDPTDPGILEGSEGLNDAEVARVEDTDESQTFPLYSNNAGDSKMGIVSSLMLAHASMSAGAGSETPSVNPQTVVASAAEGARGLHSEDPHGLQLQPQHEPQPETQHQPQTQQQQAHAHAQTLQHQQLPVVTKPAPVGLLKLAVYLPNYSHVPLCDVGKLLGVWASYVGLQLGRARVESCTPAAWGLYSAQLGGMLVLGVTFTLHYRREGRVKKRELTNPGRGSDG